jgi:ribosomal-protein-alanine N-acetyltransferase
VIRRATPQDVDAIVALEARAAAHPWSRDVFAEELARGFSHVMLLESPTPSAFVVFWHIADELSILDIATDPDVRRRGYAAQLIECVADFGRRAKCTRISLEVRQHNAPAQALYKKHGFRPIGLRANYYADTHEDAIVMERAITSAE